MSSPAACPRPEEFSALLDRELAPEEIPTLERHVEECRVCRGLFLRLAAADRMLGLVLGEVNLTEECLRVRPEAGDAPDEKLNERILEMGRQERLKAVEAADARRRARRRKRRLIVVLVLLLAVAAVAGTVQPSPLVSLSGGAGKVGAAVHGPGEVVLYRGAKVKLSDDAEVRFWCAFRWERPRAELTAGKLELLAGRLEIKAGDKTGVLSTGGSAAIGSDGEATIQRRGKPPAP